MAKIKTKTKKTKAQPKKVVKPRKKSPKKIQSKGQTILIALGGNALTRAGEEGSTEQQLTHVRETVGHCLKLIMAGYKLVITHGNGPQVGAILLKNEMARSALPQDPLDVCGAESQGQIGYMIQREFYNALAKAKHPKPVVCLLTQTQVNKNDPAFKHPTKPIGSFYKEDESKKFEKEKGWIMVHQQGKGYRRVVPSPLPMDIIEKEEIKTLVDNGCLVIACGGGGIPVVKEKDGTLTGTEAVIDKDRTAALLARKIGADVLLILTDIEQVAINFGKPTQKFLSKLTASEAQVYLEQGHFGKGSMGPKVEAACQFVEEGGHKAIITSLEKSRLALEGKAGTTITLE